LNKTHSRIPIKKLNTPIKILTSNGKHQKKKNVT
jgi:hypothetical protein